MPLSELSMLPEEILLKILKNLPERSLAKTAQVCKIFRRISYDPSLWKCIHFRSKFLRAGTIGSVLTRGTTQLHIIHCKFEEPLFHEEPPANGYKLQELLVQDIHHDFSDGLKFILSHCRHLKKVTLQIPKLSILDDHWKAIAENPQLEIFSLGCKGLTFTALITIIRRCRRLRYLTYGKLVPMTSSEVQTLVDELSTPIQALDVFSDNEALLDEHVATLVKNCPNMTDLNFRGCPSITVKTLELVTQLEKLDNLNISGCTNLPENAECWPHLHRFKTLWYTYNLN